MAWGEGAAEQHEKDQPSTPTVEQAAARFRAEYNQRPACLAAILKRPKPRTQFEVLEYPNEIVLDADERRGD